MVINVKKEVIIDFRLFQDTVNLIISLKGENEV